jgi:NadR type nicotinamide-nucleotide adenylyltransferase
MGSRKFRISVTGPESTGKSTLCALLAKHYDAQYTHELAREYITNLQRDITIEDLKIMHDLQVNAENIGYAKTKQLLFCDTDIINFKVWSEQVFKTVPPWLENSLSHNNYQFYLLCSPDIEWMADGIRKNEHNRIFLFNCFQQEIEKKNTNYAIITGQNQDRIRNAIHAVEEFLQASN